MSRTRLSGLATVLVALIAVGATTPGATARPRARADHGTYR
jgi:hypothetical protein